MQSFRASILPPSALISEYYTRCGGNGGILFITIKPIRIIFMTMSHSEKKLKYDLAIAKYSRMIREHPDDYRSYNNRGIAYQKTGQYDLAIRNYSKSLEIRPDFFLAFINRGNAYQEIGDLEAALNDYNRAIEVNPDNDMAYNNRGFHFILAHGSPRQTQIFADRCIEEMTILRDQSASLSGLLLIERLEWPATQSDLAGFVIPESE